MTTIQVSGEHAVLIETAQHIIGALVRGDGIKDDQPRSRRIPLWNSDGTEVMTIKQASIIMGLPLDVTAHHVLQGSASPELCADAVKTLRQKLKA